MFQGLVNNLTMHGMTSGNNVKKEATPGHTLNMTKTVKSGWTRCPCRRTFLRKYLNKTHWEVKMTLLTNIYVDSLFDREDKSNRSKEVLPHRETVQVSLC